MEIWWTDRFELPNEDSFQWFIERMAKRIVQGHARYGVPDSEKRYLSKAIAELRTYKRTGNAEHLINCANFCHLEDYAPQNTRHHYDPSAKSVTREDDE